MAESCLQPAMTSLLPDFEWRFSLEGVSRTQPEGNLLLGRESCAELCHIPARPVNTHLEVVPFSSFTAELELQKPRAIQL